MWWDGTDTMDRVDVRGLHSLLARAGQSSLYLGLPASQITHDTLIPHEQPCLYQHTKPAI